MVAVLWQYMSGLFCSLWMFFTCLSWENKCVCLKTDFHELFIYGSNFDSSLIQSNISIKSRYKIIHKMYIDKECKSCLHFKFISSEVFDFTVMCAHLFSSSSCRQLKSFKCTSCGHPLDRSGNTAAIFCLSPDKLINMASCVKDKNI